jgi:hypothetical protein
MEEVIVKQKNPENDAKADLEAATNTQNFTFTAKGGGEDEGGYSWKATSKVKIGDCPAKSVWEMGYEVYNVQFNELRTGSKENFDYGYARCIKD